MQVLSWILSIIVYLKEHHKEAILLNAIELNWTLANSRYREM